MRNTKNNREQPDNVVQVIGAELDVLRPDGGYTTAFDEESLRQRVHDDSQPLSALCISGGGIRSATFALGAIQSLAKRGLLDQFDYLSTVSGGGYIGGWLTAWSQRVGGLKRVIPRLLPGAERKSSQDHPISHLRRYNSYLSPNTSASSADTWTLVATIIRNLLLNWLVLIPLLMAALLLPRLYLSLLTLSEQVQGDLIFARGAQLLNYRAPELNAISQSWWVSSLLPVLFVGLLTHALFNLLRFMPEFGAKQHTTRQFRVQVLAPIVGAALAFLAFDSLYYLGSNCHPSTDYWAGDNCEGPASLINYLVAVALPALFGWLAYRYGWSRDRVVANRRTSASMLLAIASMSIGAGLSIWAAANLLLPLLDWPAYVTLGPPAILVGFALGTNLFVGVSSRFLGDDSREWMASGIAELLLFSAGWLVVCATVLIVPHWVIEWRNWAPQVLAGLAALSGWASAAAGPALAEPTAAESPGLAQRLKRAAFSAAPAVFIILLLVGLSVLANVLLTSIGGLPGATAITQPGWLLQVLHVDNPAVYGVYHAPVHWAEHYAVLTRSSPLLLVLLGALLYGFSWLAARWVNINTFSLGGMYRERLVRAYLGASNAGRQPNAFTGFASDDDIAMGDLDPSCKPLHIVNLTLNTPASERLDWQQRKARPFSVSPLHCGNYQLGYRPSHHYGGRRGISLGTAVALSGAAVSPNMGYHSSGAGAFILTLLNARLGAWLGNPGPAGANSWWHSSPRLTRSWLLKEALGRTSNEGEYVYLSDGGHFENLGLYEMVLRRCRRIVVLDSGCDPDFNFEDLGNALRKIRIDLGVPIRFDSGAFAQVRSKDKRCARAVIQYSAVDPGAPDGEVVYIKPMLQGTEPPDVANYANTHPTFPHETTNDQWFDESQTESYRMLGFTTVEQICGDWAKGSLEDFMAHVTKHYLGIEDDAVASPASDELFDYATQQEQQEQQDEDNMSEHTAPVSPAVRTTPRHSNFDLDEAFSTGLKVKLMQKAFDRPRWWMAVLRNVWPVPRVKGRAVVTRYDHVKEALDMDQVFQVPFGPRMMEMTDGPNFVLGMRGRDEHAHAHAELLAAFSEDDVNEIVRPFCKQAAEEIVNSSGGRLDAIEDLITRVPTLVVEHYYGVPIPDKRAFAQWTLAMSGYMFGPPGKRPGTAEMAVAAADNIRPVIDGAIQEVKQTEAKDRRDTALARLVAMQERGEDPDQKPGPTDEMIRAHLFGMIAGFVPTNTLAAGNVLDTLLRKPDFMAKAREAALADNDNLLQHCLFEAMRFKPINPGPFRVCVEDYTIGAGGPRAKKIPAGTKVLVSTQSAMFDGRKVKRPGRFDPARDEMNYMLFGYGLHWCIGARLAEAQVTQTFKPLLRREGLARAKGKAGRLQRRGPFPVHLQVEFDW